MGVLERRWIRVGVIERRWICMGVIGRRWIRMGVIERRWIRSLGKNCRCLSRQMDKIMKKKEKKI